MRLEVSPFRFNNYLLKHDFLFILDKLVDGKVDVVNAARKKSVTGALSSTHGVAERPDPNVPGKLTVQFPGARLGNCKMYF